MKPRLYWIPGAECGRLATMPRPRGGEWLEEEVAALAREGVAVVVSLLTPPEVAELDLAREAELCEAAGLTFLSFPIEDYSLPSSMTGVDEFLHRVRLSLAAGLGVALHCRAGIGRSSMLAACLLIDAGCEPDAALARITAARGCPVPDTPEQRQWIRRYAAARSVERELGVGGWGLGPIGPIGPIGPMGADDPQRDAQYPQPPTPSP